MRMAIRWATLTGAVLLSAPATARADESAAEREAQARFEEGVARVKAGNIEGARMSFAQAYSVVRKPTILWNLALAEEKTRHVLDALAHFKELARGAQTGDDRASAEKHISDLVGQTGHFDVMAPAGAQVLVDGTPVGTAPLSEPVDVMPGRHHVEAHTAHGAKEIDADVGAGQVARVGLIPASDVRPSAPIAPTAQEGPAPMRVTTSQLAEHGSSAEHARGSGTSAPEVIVVALVGTAAAVSVGLGAYFAVQSQQDQNAVQGFRRDNPNWLCFPPTSSLTVACTSWNDAVQAQSNDAMLSSVFYVTGGVLAAGALAAWLLWPKAPTSDDAHLRLIPAVGPTSAGLGAAGAF